VVGDLIGYSSSASYQTIFPCCSRANQIFRMSKEEKAEITANNRQFWQGNTGVKDESHADWLSTK
jgi:uncharacterized protein VirK/YbjX